MDHAGLVALVLQLVQQQREMAEDQQFMLQRLLDSDDRRTLQRLLPAAWACMGTSLWTAADLVKASTVSSTRADAVSDAVAEYIGIDGDLRQLGKLLARVEGVACNGLRLVRCGTDNGRALYSLRSHRSGFEGAQTTADAGADDDGE